MASLNKVMLMGNLTRDPEVRYTPKGTAVAMVGLAVNRRWTAENGEQKEEVTFIDVEVWGKQAETVSQYMSKGKPIFIEGRLKLDSWEDKESHQKRSKLKVVCEHFQFIGAPGAKAEFKEGGEERPQRAARPAARSEEPPADAASGGEDNIPF